MTTPATTAISRDPEVLGGVPVFAGTRVGVKILIDYLADGQRVEDFLRYYPSVTRDQAIAVLDEAERLLDASGGGTNPSWQHRSLVGVPGTTSKASAAADDRSPAELVLETDRTMRAVRRAHRQTLLEHKSRGDPIVVWEDGHARWVPAEDIVVPDADPTEG